jgi:hypothetical protein
VIWGIACRVRSSRRRSGGGALTTTEANLRPPARLAQSASSEPACVRRAHNGDGQASRALALHGSQMVLRHCNRAPIRYAARSAGRARRFGRSDVASSVRRRDLEKWPPRHAHRRAPGLREHAVAGAPYRTCAACEPPPCGRSGSEEGCTSHAFQPARSSPARSGHPADLDCPAGPHGRGAKENALVASAGVVVSSLNAERESAALSRAAAHSTMAEASSPTGSRARGKSSSAAAAEFPTVSRPSPWRRARSRGVIMRRSRPSRRLAAMGLDPSTRLLTGTLMPRLVTPIAAAGSCHVARGRPRAHRPQQWHFGPVQGQRRQVGRRPASEPDPAGVRAGPASGHLDGHYCVNCSRTGPCALVLPPPQAATSAPSCSVVPRSASIDAVAGVHAADPRWSWGSTGEGSPRSLSHCGPTPGPADSFRDH